MNWTCPACGASQPQAMEECPRCGIIVSKFSERKRVDSDCRPLQTNWQARPTASGTTTWITIAGSVILCLVLGAALLKWVGGSHRNAAKTSPGPGQVSTGLKKFTVDNLQEDVVAVSRNQPVLIEFYSTNWMPCRRMESVLNEIAQETAGQATVGLVFPDQRKLFESFQVRLIPALFVIRDAEVKKSYEGMVSKEQLMKDLREYAATASR